MKIALAGAALILLSAPHAALAAHGKAGLWEITIKIDGQYPNMPDLSKLPPEVQARMKEMGIGANANGITIQQCRTPAEVAQNVPPSGAHDKSCALSNVSYAGGSMSADMTCTGNFTGSGHMHFVWDTDEHYAGEIRMTGMSGGRPMTRTQKIEGRWLSPQCTAAQR